ncbi:MAG: hypothetical protein NC820_03330 [Candidatus Omnitrophica bacterium]|nr:hypothetical protein [Candidatus Omnitrophota bacterium]
MDVEADLLNSLESNLGYYFNNKSLLLQAITHKTFAYESLKFDVRDNQRLEFLGDSVLNLAIADHLYSSYPYLSEGDMTRKRSLLVNKQFLADKTKEVGIAQYLLLGKGEEKLGGRYNPTNLSSALEAIIGAIYLDGGWEEAKKFILNKLVS